jgi:hypothetical protein
MIRATRFGSLPKRFLTETTGSGAGFIDYDGDGNLDVYVVNGKSREQAEAGMPGEPDLLYRNLSGRRFVEVARLAGVAETEWGGGVAAGDYDNDGDPDLLVTNFGPNVFYRNNGDGTFTDVTERAGLADRRWSTSAAFGDINGDGFLDLYVCHYLDWNPRHLESIAPDFCRWRGIPVVCGPRGLPGDADRLYLNRGDGTFADITERAGVYNPEGKGLGVAFLDFDGDRDQDIFVSNDSTPNFLYQNDGRGQFKDVALGAGVAFSMYGKPQAGMGTDSGDFDEDGKPDLIVTNFQKDYNALRRNLGTGLFVDVSNMVGLALSTWDKLGWGVKFFDCNNDGFLDLFTANGHIYAEVDSAGIGETYAQLNQLALNVPATFGRRFEDLSARAGPGLRIEKSSRGLAIGDYDNDGDLDIFINEMNDVPTFVEDQARHTNGSVRLTLIGRAANRDGMGARVEYTVGGKRHSRYGGALGSYLSTSDPRLHLGLGSAALAESIVIYWPPMAGREPTITRLGPVYAGEDVVVVEGIGRVR